MTPRFPFAALIQAIILSGPLALSCSAANDQPVINNKIVRAQSDPQLISAVQINAVTRNLTVHETPVQLAKAGTTLLPITIATNASPSVKLAAAELAKYLEQISGAKFEIKTGETPRGITIGTLADFPDTALNVALAIHNTFDGKEAYAIRCGEGSIRLIGATDLGTSHAVYRFLEELGVRWFRPDAAWEVVPKQPNITWKLNLTDRPSMLSRVIWFEAGSGGPEEEKLYADWKRHNQKAESFVANTGHNLFVIPAAFPEEFKQHPEYYAMMADGKLSNEDIELTNPAVRQLVVEYVRRTFKTNPQADMVSIDPPDTASHSQRPEALKTPYSDQIFGLANEVARMLQKEFPGKTVGLLSYNAHYDPPSFKLEPNVHVQLSSMSVNPSYGPEERAKIWATRSSNLGVYEYYSVFAWSSDTLPGSYVNGLHSSQRHIRDELIKRNVIALSAESTSTWGANGLGYYAAAKLFWNPDLDVDALYADYLEKAFGPAGPAMKNYYNRLSTDSNPLMSGHLLGLLFQDVNKATVAAKDRPDVLARLDQIKLYLRFADLMFRKWTDGVRISEPELLANTFRTRKMALTSWEMIRQQWAGGKYPGQADAPEWMQDKPYTREEIEKDFQDGLTYYQGRIRDVGPRLSYSSDLVPINWDTPAKNPDQENTQSYQGSVKYALYSIDGSPLKFTTEAGDAWGYKTSFTVTDPGGKIIASGKPEGKTKVSHRIQVAKPGLYYLNYNDPGAYWTFGCLPDQLMSIDMHADVMNGRTAKIFNEMFFYVPKGTKKLEYFITNPHYVIGPDGSDQKRVEKANDYITVEVPPGMDGQPWSFRFLDLGKIYFSNAPSYFAPNRNQLLVPREVALKDQLPLLK